MKKRVLAILLALAMVAALLPVAALADDKGFTASNPFTSVEEYRKAIGTTSDEWEEKSSYAKYSGKNVYLMINGQILLRPIFSICQPCSFGKSLLNFI